MSKLVPTQMFFTKGVGYHKNHLQSFELALRDAGIEKCNLVNVSSIFPPGCRVIPRNEGIAQLSPGAITFTVMARECTNEPNRLIASSIGVAQPKDKTHYGYLSEHHAFGQTARISGDFAEDLAATMLAKTLGIDFDPDKNYDERKEIYRMSGRIVESTSITQSARGDTNGRWTTVLAAAVFII